MRKIISTAFRWVHRVAGLVHHGARHKLRADVVSADRSGSTLRILGEGDHPGYGGFQPSEKVTETNESLRVLCDALCLREQRFMTQSQTLSA